VQQNYTGDYLDEDWADFTDAPFGIWCETDLTAGGTDEDANSLWNRIAARSGTEMADATEGASSG
jgi:hypothetical protein